MHDVYKNIDEYNPDKENKILIVFDNMIADIHNKKLNSIVTELFIRGRKLNISLVFITQLYFKVPKDFRLNTAHFFIAKIPNERELQQIAINHSSEAAKISALSSGKIHKYEYLTGEDILPSNQQQIIEQAKFTYPPLGKAFEKQIKTIQDQGQVKTIKKYDYDAEDNPIYLKTKRNVQ